jgi:hypothetical protein
LDLKTFEKPVKKNGEKQFTVILWPTGLSSLPSWGGIDEQNFIYTRLFSAFLAGERDGAIERINRGSN